MSSIAPINALFHKPELTIADPQLFERVLSAIREHFAGEQIRDFLASLHSRKARIRDFESVLGKGLLGGEVRDAYGLLTPGDQGQIREYYLGSLERVAPELRQKFFKLYSYY